MKRMRGDVRSPEALARFVEEIRVIGRLEHPNIVPIHDVGIDEDGQYYFVMKYVAGETLEAIIDRLRAGDRETHRLFPFDRRVQLFRGLLEAVAFAHSRGIVHRDIKPSNVMVGPHGEVLLMDWGIAKAIRGDGYGIDDALLLRAARATEEHGRVLETEVGTVIGTPIYMAPEQARGQAVDERSDVYSLSVLFHELLSLHHYLEGRDTFEEVIEGVVSSEVGLASFGKSRHQPVVPMDLRWLVRKGLRKDPARRYQSVAEMIERLDLRSQGLVPIECHITFVKRVTSEWLRFVDRHPFLVTSALLALVAGSVGLAVFRLL
jgi:serine/threonine-protein kinase